MFLFLSMYDKPLYINNLISYLFEFYSGCVLSHLRGNMYADTADEYVLKETILTLHCLPGYNATAPISQRCMGNNEWDDAAPTQGTCIPGIEQS